MPFEPPFPPALFAGTITIVEHEHGGVTPRLALIILTDKKNHSSLRTFNPLFFTENYQMMIKLVITKLSLHGRPPSGEVLLHAIQVPAAGRYPSRSDNACG